jgi:hypothetical protein
MSSKRSDEQTMRVVEELVALLVKDEKMKRLIDAALKKFAVDIFERNFARLLKIYSKDLQSEASNHLEKRAVAFVRNQARLVAKFFTRQLKQDDRNEIFDFLIQKEADRADLLESFLQHSVMELPLANPIIRVIELMDFESKTKSQSSEGDSDESEPGNRKLEDDGRFHRTSNMSKSL